MENPPPRYDDKIDDVRCFMSGTFGGSRWPLVPAELTYPKSEDRFRYFARFLLEGQVRSMRTSVTLCDWVQ